MFGEDAAWIKLVDEIIGRLDWELGWEQEGLPDPALEVGCELMMAELES